MHLASFSLCRAPVSMSSAELSCGFSRRAHVALGVAVGLSFLAAPDGARAAALGKTYFFATRDACVASGAFSPRECAGAFANARAQMRDKAPRFAAIGECRLHFRLCQPTLDEAPAGDVLSYAPAEEPTYAPQALGVEMIASPRGVEAAPTLAVETPKPLFRYFPVSKVYEADDGQTEQAKASPDETAILSPDRFVPFARRKPFTGETTFAATALGAIEGATSSSPMETREQRRQRLRSAPFVQ